MIDFNPSTREQFDFTTAKAETEISYNPVTGKREEYMYNFATNTYIPLGIENEEDLECEMQEYEEGYTGYGSPGDGHDWFNGVPVPIGWLND